jgi:hypothetical protein
MMSLTDIQEQPGARAGIISMLVQYEIRRVLTSKILLHHSRLGLPDPWLIAGTDARNQFGGSPGVLN